MGCCQELLNNLRRPAWHALLRFRKEISQLEEVRKRSSIQELLYRFRIRKATDDRDMVYGLFVLMDEMLTEPDYSLDKTNVYKQIVLHSIGREKILSILEGQRTPLMEGPTWIYDWSSPMKSSLWYPEEMQLQVNQLYSASLVPNIRFFTCGDQKLSLDGIMLDKVSLLGTYPEFCKSELIPQSFGKYLNDFLKIIGDWERNSKVASHPNSSKVDCKNSFWRTLIGDRYYEIPNGNTSASWRRARLEDVRQFEEMEARTSCYQVLNETEKLEFNQCYDQIFIASAGRKFFLTEKGFMGCGNPQVGDEVWLLFGGRIPFVLRPNQDGSTFSMIGDCYLHGFMDGETMADAETKKRRVVLTRFVL